MSVASDSLVRVIAGKLGSGKTWYAVMQAMEALMRGDVVVSNVAFNWPAVEAYCRKQGCKVPRDNYRYFETEDVSENPNKLFDLLTQGSFLLFDEVHLVLDSRNWAANAQKAGAFQLLLTQARKLRVDMFFISQASENIDNRIVRQASFIVRVSNWLHLPVLGTLLPLPITIARTCGPDGRTVYAKQWIWRRSGGVGRLYNSKQTFQSIELRGAGAKKVIGQKRRRLGYGWVLMMVGAGGLVMERVMFGPGEKKNSAALSGAVSADDYRSSMRRQLGVKEAAPAARPAVAAVGELEPVHVGGAFSRGTVAAFEMQLPRVWKVSPFGVVCVNGFTIRPGVALGPGVVVGWSTSAGFVTVHTDSPVMPDVRFFYGSNRFLCDDVGAPLWVRDRASFRSDAAHSPQVAPVVGGSPVSAAPAPAPAPTSSAMASGVYESGQWEHVPPVIAAWSGRFLGLPILGERVK